MQFPLPWKPLCLGLVAGLAVSTAGCDGFKEQVARRIVAAAAGATRVDRGFHVIDGADPARFETCGRFYAKDGRHVYHGGNVVAGADPATFAAHDGPFIGDTGVPSGPGPDAHDAQREYKSGRVYDRKAIPRKVAPPADRPSDFADGATKEVLGRLAGGETRESAIRDITTAPDGYAPPVLYEVASALFADGRKDEAMFWFYLGQLRARSDANKLNDASGQRTVAVFNERHGSRINRHAFKDLNKLRKVVGDVIAWDRTHQRTYDPRWITDGAGGRSGELFDERRWPRIDDAAREKYQRDFEDAVRKAASEVDADGDGIISDEEREAYQENGPARRRRSAHRQLPPRLETHAGFAGQPCS